MPVLNSFPHTSFDRQANVIVESILTKQQQYIRPLPIPWVFHRHQGVVKAPHGHDPDQNLPTQYITLTDLFRFGSQLSSYMEANKVNGQCKLHTKSNSAQLRGFHEYDSKDRVRGEVHAGDLPPRYFGVVHTKA